MKETMMRRDGRTDDGRTDLRLHRVEVRETLGEERLELRGAQGRDGEGLQVQQLLWVLEGDGSLVWCVGV